MPNDTLAQENEEVIEDKMESVTVANQNAALEAESSRQDQTSEHQTQRTEV